MRALISQLNKIGLQDFVEICGKVVYIDIGNKSLSLKSNSDKIF